MLTEYALLSVAANPPNVQVAFAEGLWLPCGFPSERVEVDGFAVGLGVISPIATNLASQHRRYRSACVAACVSRMQTMGLELSVLGVQMATFPFCGVYC